MGNDDATMSVMELRERQLIIADSIIARAQQLCEKVLSEQGDQADMSVVNLQHDCVSWSGVWISKPVMGQRVDADGIIPVDFNQKPEQN